MDTPPTPVVLINPDRCTGCGWCVAACPLDLLSLERDGWEKRSVIHDAHRCTGCRLCERRCLFGAISVSAAVP